MRFDSTLRPVRGFKLTIQYFCPGQVCRFVSSSSTRGYELTYRSGSMTCRDRGPMRDAPSFQAIARSSNNRYGAVIAACYRSVRFPWLGLRLADILSFWSSRQAVIASSGPSATRRDAYSVILFNERPTVVVENDYTSSADDLLSTCLRVSAGGGTNFAAALDQAQTTMLTNVSIPYISPPTVGPADPNSGRRRELQSSSS